jgi:hypothetical protein
MKLTQAIIEVSALQPLTKTKYATTALSEQQKKNCVSCRYVTK